MKEFWLNKNECTGCGACSNVCPVFAISMQEDICGFKYPVIDGKCVDCNLCEKCCKDRLKLNIRNSENPKVYAAWSRNEATRFNSTSGGIFSELASYIIKKGGYVVGARYNKKMLVEHVIISEIDDLSIIRQSKYIQSDMKTSYCEIKKLLDNNKLVAFCGAPCQTAALYAYLGNKEYKELYTFDFICRGMNSPKAYIAWLKEIEKNVGKKASNVWFKYKENGWKKSPKCTRIDFSDGTNIIMNQEENLFMCGYLNENLYIRPSCGECMFKGVPRCSDITLADFWGIEGKLDDDKGTSLVMINSERGNWLFRNVRENIIAYERHFEELKNGNICFDSSVEISKQSEKFLRNLDKETFSKSLNKYINKNKGMKQKLKRLFYERNFH